MHADHSNSQVPAPEPRAGRGGGGMGKVLSSAAATLALGGATAVSADPSLAGAAALLAGAPAWLTPALAGATGLAGLRLLFAMRPRRKPAAARAARPEVVEERDLAAPAVAEEEIAAAPPRRAVSDPSAVFPVYSAAAPPRPAAAAVAGDVNVDVDEDGDEANGDLLPFPSADPAAQTGWEYDAEEGEVGEDDFAAGAPATIRFEDIPSSVTIGSRTVDLTEAADADHRHDALKGLTKKEKRTVRNALRDRERLLRRAA